jgi:hypothetical protein
VENEQSYYDSLGFYINCAIVFGLQTRLNKNDELWGLNPEVVGSNPTPATTRFFRFPCFIRTTATFSFSA